MSRASFEPVVSVAKLVEQLALDWLIPTWCVIRRSPVRFRPETFFLFQKSTFKTYISGTETSTLIKFEVFMTNDNPTLQSMCVHTSCVHALHVFESVILPRAVWVACVLY